MLELTGRPIKGNKFMQHYRAIKKILRLYKRMLVTPNSAIVLVTNVKIVE